MPVWMLFIERHPQKVIFVDVVLRKHSQICYENIHRSCHLISLWYLWMFLKTPTALMDVFKNTNSFVDVFARNIHRNEQPLQTAHASYHKLFGFEFAAMKVAAFPVVFCKSAQLLTMTHGHHSYGTLCSAPWPSAAG